MNKRTIFLLSAVLVVIIVIAAINLAIKKYEKEPVSPANSPLKQEPAQTEATPVENKAEQANEDIETEPPIPTNRPLSY
ncbi:MAG: hypothetical protein A3K83_01360 [Omnitrophica WOR_2 bacterium RBG_13_44_8b]|nr:MAG: hypothetical protein A3K83_01360 [Omnitrophica WOR_2 bacterium RBG_13_44_8b]